MARSNKRRKPQSPGKLDLDTKRARWKVIEEMAKLLIEFQKEKSSQKDRYGVFGARLKEKQRICPWLTRSMVTGKKTRILEKMMMKKKEKSEAIMRQQQEQRKKDALKKKTTTMPDKMEVAKKKVAFKVKLTDRYKQAKATSATRLPRGTYDKLHNDLLREMGIDTIGFSIPYSTIKARIRRNNVTATNQKRTRTANCCT